MSSRLNKVTLKKLNLKDLNTIWHDVTGLVFKSSTEKLVIGRCINDTLVPLDKEAIKLCEEWKFKYDTSLKIKDDDEEADEEADEGEAEGEEDGEADAEGEGDGDGEGEGDGEEDGEEDGEGDGEADENGNQVEEGEVDVKEEDNKVVLSRNVQPLTDNFNHSFDLITKDFFKKLIDNESELLEKIRKLEDALLQKSTDFNNMKTNFEDMKDKHGKLKTKFDGIKKLFS